MISKKRNIWEYRNFWLIWFSCMDKPRTLYELQDIWKLKGNPLYQRERVGSTVADMMVRGGFLKEENGKYYSLFDKYFEATKKSFPKDIETIDLIEKDKEEFLDFFDSKLVRNSFFSLNNLKLLSKDTLIKEGFRIPLLVITTFLTTLYFYKEKILTEDSMLKNLSSAFTLFSSFLLIIGKGMSEYLKSSYEQWDLNELKKFEHLLKTKYGKEIKKRVERSLEHPLLKKFFKGYHKLGKK